MRHQQKLRKAREQLAICAHNSCPSVVTLDCATWQKEVDSAIPTLLFHVRDERGHPVADFRVLVDGEPLSHDLDGPLPSDPGPHVVRVEAVGFAPLEQNVILKAGEHGRVLDSTLLSARREPTAAELPPDPLRNPPKAESRPDDKTTSERKQESKALPDPPLVESSSARENVDATRTKLVAANVSLGVGLGAIAVAGILWLTGSPASPKSTGRPRLVGLAVVPSPLGGGEVVTTFSAP